MVPSLSLSAPKKVTGKGDSPLVGDALMDAVGGWFPLFGRKGCASRNILQLCEAYRSPCVGVKLVFIFASFLVVLCFPV